MALFSRRAKTDGDGTEEAPARTAAPRRVSVSPSELRRERRALLREREQGLQDLGGLALEMFRQDSFREHLLYERCADVAAIDERLFELERLLDVRRAPAARCDCGAPIFWGSHFCGNCGRPVGEPIVGCAACGHALSADARFCPECGTASPSQAS